MRQVKVYFIVCLVIIVSILKTAAQSQGPLNPGVNANDISGGAVSWVTPTNSSVSDNTYAIATNGLSNYLGASGFGFSIPSTANITGISLDVERKAAPVNAVASDTWVNFISPTYTSGTATALYGNTTYSYNLPVSSAANNQRLLIVTVGIENVDNIAPSNPAITFGTVTYNGVPMILATSNALASATTSNSVAVYYLPESGLPATTGSRSLVVGKTFNGELSSGTISPAEFVEVVGVNTFSNVDQSLLLSSVSQTSATSPITSPTIGNLRNGDYMVAATMNNSSSGASVTQGSGYTENFERAHNNSGGATTGAILEVQSKSLAGVTGNPNTTVTATASGASRLVMGALALHAARVYDKAVVLTNAFGIQTGNNKAVVPANNLPNAWPDTDTYTTYGGSSDLWGTTWTPADINTMAFGLDFQADATNSIASVDHIRMTVYYSVPLGLSEEVAVVQQTKELSLSDAEVSIYPNPVIEYILVQSGSEIKSFNLFNAAGIEIAVTAKRMNEKNIRLENIPGNGCYNLVLYTQSGIISKRIIVNN